MNTSSYREYDAWLQPKHTLRGGPVRLAAAPEVSAVALRECREGLCRLWGAQAVAEDARVTLTLSLDGTLPAQGYHLTGTADAYTIAGADAQGLLYGVFRFLQCVAAGQPPHALDVREAPRCLHRVINHWDNMSGKVERGYAGRSLFFEGEAFAYDAQRVRDYARLLASVGINALSINNVNVTDRSARLITAEDLPQVAALADIFRPYGIRLLLSVHFESPVILGGLPSADPLDAQVADWWRQQTALVYRHVPDLLGFLVKADSEFRSGPEALGRTQADGANMMAEALAPHGGLVFWRCFVYNCRQDWRDTTTDRPKAAYDHFYPLDGRFADNVILQIKNGPSDFQVREPVSPLFTALRHTHEAIEYQVTQEYTGHQIDLCALASQWEQILSTPIDPPRALRDLYGGPIRAVTAVGNVGRDENWTGHTLAQCNLYAFGRMAFQPELTAREVVQEWVRLTFEADADTLAAIDQMMLTSYAVYESYNAPLGIGWMVYPQTHYGPSVDGYEYSRWGTYHRADHTAIGVDRTTRGTGYTAQYVPALRDLYDDPATCPQELLLFFHRLRYDDVLPSGDTVLQHIYSTHFDGVNGVERYIAQWAALQEHLPAPVHASVAARLARQLENAREWRDQVNTYFYRKTGIADAQGRAIIP